MFTKKIDLSPGNNLIKQRRDIKHISFFKQKMTGLSPINKLSPFKESNVYHHQQLFNKQYASVDYTKSKQPLFNTIQYRSKPKNVFLNDSSCSPKKSPNMSNYSSQQRASKKQLSCQIQRTKRQEEKVTFNSLKSQNIYSESLTSIEQTLRLEQKPDDIKLILGLKSLIRKEKQVILNDVEQIAISTDKLEQKSSAISQENYELKKQFEEIRENDKLNLTLYGSTISKYNKIIQLLTELSINYETIMPELKNDYVEEMPENNPDENKDETILLQQFMIKKLVNQIEEQKQQNQLLIQKIRQ